jgi:hypothetical protein
LPLLPLPSPCSPSPLTHPPTTTTTTVCVQCRSIVSHFHHYVQPVQHPVGPSQMMLCYAIVTLYCVITRESLPPLRAASATPVVSLWKHHRASQRITQHHTALCCNRSPRSTKQHHTATLMVLFRSIGTDYFLQGADRHQAVTGITLVPLL